MINSITFGSPFLACFPLIEVRNTDTGETHVVGTDPHDQLQLTEKGTITYVNLQNQGSIGDGYEFVCEPPSIDPNKRIPFVDANEFANIAEETKNSYSVLDEDIAEMANFFLDKRADGLSIRHSIDNKE